MPSPHRLITPFNPRLRLLDDWSEWTVHFTRLHGIDEVIDVDHHLVLIEVGQDGEDWALSHALAHLELGHHKGAGPLTTEQESQADWLARMWLN